MTIWQKLSKIQLATWVMFSVLFLIVIIVISWFAGEGTINHLFQYLNYGQEHPPLWVKTPNVISNHLLFWIVGLLSVVWVIMKMSPRPCRWSRTLIVLILIVLTTRYLLWRSLSTLNLGTPLNGVFSLGLFLLEMLLILTSIIQLILMLRVRNRLSQADRLSIDVISGAFTPTVDILIPTFNELVNILRRTVIGCQALDYDFKTIYLLDDSQRSEIKALAAELGCKYIARTDHNHAKAGNLNYALSENFHAVPYTNGELIVVFDADFVPTKNFLQRTVGFFQDSQVALVG